MTTLFTNTQTDKAQIMILGVYHFDNPNLDLIASDYPDHLSPQKQAEIGALLDRLAPFAPTKIVVEAPPDHAVLAQRYEAYLQGDYELPASEIYQIGFRMGKRLGHPRLYGADYRQDMDMGAVITAAQATGNTAFLAKMGKVQSDVEALQRRHGQMAVYDALAELNEPAWQRQTWDLYLQLVQVRQDGNFVGADVLAKWYQRNLYILANIMALVESPQERVLVVFGQGHIPYLRDGVSSFVDVQLVEPNDYLRP